MYYICHILGHVEREKTERDRQGMSWELSIGSGSGGIRESEWSVFIQVYSEADTLTSFFCGVRVVSLTQGFLKKERQKWLPKCIGNGYIDV